METRQTDLVRLLTGNKVFLIPQFQRHYKWKQAQWTALFDDITEQYQSEAVQSGRLVPQEGHFLGSIVLHPAPGPVSTVARYLVIDGQQRLTTLALLIAAMRDERQSVDPKFESSEYDFQYLSNPYSQTDRYRLVPGDNDREDYMATVHNGDANGQVGAAYLWFRKAIRLLLGDAPGEYLKFEKAVLLRMLIVEINTSADDNINQIFHTINHAGMKLTAIDLIRNYSFMQLDQDEVRRLYETMWRPMERALVNEPGLSLYLWTQLVRRSPRATQRDLYGPFVSIVERDTRGHSRTTGQAVEALLGTLLDEIELFQLVRGDETTNSRNLPSSVRELLAELARWGSLTYLPLAMELLSRHRQRSISITQVERALRAVLSFLVRRGLAGIPTNNLNRILSAIPSALPQASDVDEAVLNELSAASRYWPSDRELIERGLSSAVLLTLQEDQLKYCLEKLSRHASTGVAADARDFLDHLDEKVVQQIMPQELSSYWRETLNQNHIPEEVAASRVNVIGNLTLSESDLSELATFPRVRGLLQEEGLPLNRHLFATETWLPTDIDDRSRSLLGMACEVWRGPSRAKTVVAETVSLTPNAFDVATVLGAVSGDALVLVDDVAQICGVSPSHVEEVSASLGYPLIDREVNGVLRRMISPLAGREANDVTNDSPLLSTDEVVRQLESVGAASTASV